MPELHLLDRLPAPPVSRSRSRASTVGGSRSVLRKALCALALAFSVALAGCGGADSAEDTPAAASGDTAMTEPSASAAPAGRDASMASREKFNLNEASEEDFQTIPGVGDRMVHEFFEYRPYVSIQQFRQEIGKYVDQDQVAAYEQYVFVPIAPDESDAATLQQIPGLDAAQAEALIAARPYASRQAFLDRLRTRLTEDQLATAEKYVEAP